MNLETRKIALAQLIFDSSEDLINKFEAILKEQRELKNSVPIPQWQIDEVNKRLEQVDNGTMPTKSWKEVKNNILNS